MPSANVIVDAGAYVGLTQVRIFAIEAERSYFELMLKNVRPYPNITPIHAALWGSEGYISIGDPLPRGFGNWGFTVSSRPGDVRTITIRSLMRDFSIDHIDLLKIDIEGSEKEVFEACDWQDRLDSPKPHRAILPAIVTGPGLQNTCIGPKRFRNPNPVRCHRSLLRRLGSS